MRAHKIHPLITGIIQTALLACEGVRFHSAGTCISCGSPISGYDERKKRFAILLKDELPRPVHVVIQRSYCHNCGKITEPPEPFYTGTRLGSPVVDLCRSLTETMPYSRVSTILNRMGVQVDRWSVRHYAQIYLPDVPAIELFGMQIPQSVISLSTVAVTPNEPGPIEMDDVLLACNYPFIPNNSSIPGNEAAISSITPENQQNIIERLGNGFSRSLGIVFISSIIVMNLVYGNVSGFPPGLIDSLSLDTDILSMNGFWSI